MDHANSRSANFVLLLASFAVPISAIACGLNWNEPKSHFGGVGFQGYVFLVEDIGEVDAGSGLTLPLRAIFRSESSTTSPYVGYGWDIPLLESHIVQVDERWFRMLEPTGWYRLFWRDEKTPNILHGQNGWKGEIKENQVTVWADCGSKMVFHRGRISYMQLKDRRFEYSYNGGRVDAIKDGNVTLLSVDVDPISGDIKGIKLSNNKKIALERGPRPRVQVINGQNLLSGVDQALSKVVGRNTKTFDYAVDDNLNPTIKFESRTIVWNPESKRIIKDGDWFYNIKPGSKPFDYAAIDRKNESKQHEFWHNDQNGGQETVLRGDGTQTITSWFISGPLAGKKRAIEITRSGKTLRTSFNYDENGKLMRKVLADGRIDFYIRDAKGSLEKIERKKDGQTVLEERFDKSGRRIASILSGNPVKEILYKDSKEQYESIKKILAKYKIPELRFPIWSIQKDIDKESISYLLKDSEGNKIAMIDKFGHLQTPGRDPQTGSPGTFVNGILRTSWDVGPDGRKSLQRFYKKDGAISSIYKFEKPNSNLYITKIFDKSDNLLDSIEVRYDSLGRVVEYNHLKGDSYVYDYSKNNTEPEISKKPTKP